MNPKNLLKSAAVLFFATVISLTGCKKEADLVQPSDSSIDQGAGLKATASGKIMSYIVNGNYQTSVVCNLSNTVTLKINVYTLGFYNITSNTANGIQFSKSGEFKLKGLQDVVLYGNGTPLATGCNTFTVSFGGYSTTYKVVTVSNIPVTITSCNNSFTYMQVANHKTCKTWLDRNLGATRVATSANDYLAYGSLFQWGRLNDGHQCITWTNANTGVGQNGSTTTASNSNTPGHSMFIKGNLPSSDWRVPQNNNLWQGVSGINNPCPSGFRIPTAAEMVEEIASWGSKNTTGGYGSSLKWAVAGYREFYDATVYDAGVAGGVWTSTVYNNTKAMILWVSSTDAYTLDDFRAEGYSVRCIKN